jgi:signal transduction histidine kinase
MGTAVRPSPVRAPSSMAMMTAAICAVAFCAVLAAVLRLVDLQANTFAQQLAVAFRVVASAFFVGAGVLRISHWRIAGDARSALTGVALVVLGASAIPLSSIAATLESGTSGAAEEQVARAVAVTVVLWLVVRALGGRSDDRDMQAGRVIATALSVSVLAFVGLVLLDQWRPDALTLGAPFKVALQLTIALGWVTVALLAWRQRSDLEWAGRVAPLMGAMGIVATLHAIDINAEGSLALEVTSLSAIIACITAYGALMDLVVVTTSDQVHLQGLEDALDHAKDVLHDHHERRQELSHDASNALAGLRAALGTLERYAGSLDSSTIEHLRSAAIDEVGHLEHLIVRREHDRPMDFELDRVVRTVVPTRRAAGLDVRLGDIHGVAHGRPADLSTALHNLLVNAALHAPGSPVDVRSSRVGDRLLIMVSDRGPGIAREDVARVFERGVRGPRSAGTGLGLYIARELMREQDGDLVLDDSGPGCVFVLCMPVAQPEPAVADVPEQRQAPALEARPVAEVG